MKNINNKLKTIALPVMLVVVMIGFGSCTKEPAGIYKQQDKEFVDFALELSPPGVYTAPTKAMTDAQQNAINSAEVLVFQGDVMLYHKTGTVSDIDGVRKRVQVQLKTSQTEIDLFDIMVIGNAPASFTFASYVGKTKDELKAAFTASSSAKWAGSEFVMYGQAKQTIIQPTTNIFKIQMLRSLARIDVGVGAYDETTDTWAGIADLELREVRVVNTRNEYAIIPTTTTLNEDGNIKVATTTVPASSAVQGTTAASALSYSGADIKDGKYTKSSIFVAEGNATDKLSLIIGGSYKGGGVTYYRVDMCVPSTTTPGSYDYLNILRNHLYRISITSVAGAGFSNPQEALNSSPINIKVELTPIDEGGFGDVVFNGGSYIMTDASSVQIYGTPDGEKKYTIANVKTSRAGAVSGTGIATPIDLVAGKSKTISVALPATTTSGSYIITTGGITKTITLTVQPDIDAHFDVLPFAGVANIIVENPQSWLTLSNNMTYVKSEQQTSSILGNSSGVACMHFDEYIATSGEKRMATARVMRINGSGTTRVIVEQRNLSGSVLGFFGDAKDNYGYTAMVAVESIEEYAVRKYDMASIGSVTNGIQWGFYNAMTNVVDIEFGKAGTIALANRRSDSGVSAPYTIYNNFAAKYCYDKNRDTNGNGMIDNSEVLWYLPSLNQLMSVWVANSAVDTPLGGGVYWSATENNRDYGWHVSFVDGGTTASNKLNNGRVRCLREL